MVLHITFLRWVACINLPWLGLGYFWSDLVAKTCFFDHIGNQSVCSCSELEGGVKSTLLDSLSWKAFIVLHLVHTKVTGMVKKCEEWRDRGVQTLAPSSPHSADLPVVVNVGLLVFVKVTEMDGRKKWDGGGFFLRSYSTIWQAVLKKLAGSFSVYRLGQGDVGPQFWLFSKGHLCLCSNGTLTSIILTWCHIRGPCVKVCPSGYP